MTVDSLIVITCGVSLLAERWLSTITSVRPLVTLCPSSFTFKSPQDKVHTYWSPDLHGHTGRSPTCLLIEQRILSNYFIFYFMAIEVNPRDLSFALDCMSHHASDG